MNTILKLLIKDLRRDVKHPWGIVALMFVPLLMGGLMGLAFGPNSNPQEQIVLHIAIVDLDKEMLSGMLRSVSNQGDTGENLVIHYAETEEEGISMLEKRQASALLVLPENLTNDLVSGATATIRFYGNPAEQFLPIVVEQGTELLSVGLSQLIRLIRPQLQIIKELIEKDEFPPIAETVDIVEESLNKMKHLEMYLFPPIIQMDTIPSSDYIPSVSRTPKMSNDLEGTS